VCLILGNGFTMDFIKHVSEKKPEISGKICLNNLFKDGDALRWPLDKRPGFLSYKNCPNLWSVGARSFLNASETQEILERVVTCANVYSLKRSDDIIEKTGNGFLHAYKELVSYLKYLFIYYDSILPVLDDSIDDWPWARFLSQLQNDTTIDEVTIVTYNYDIWLEKLLMRLGIPFEMPLISAKIGSKFKIFKPHGSISYQHTKSLPPDSFSINYKSFFIDCALSDINISYTNLEQHTAVNFLIPPAGESGRNSNTWAQSIRNECSSRIRNFGATDLAIVCGISYWHVDRAEIDALLNAMHPEMEMIHLNPSPSPTMDAVLNSLFTKYTHITKSSLLEEYPV